MKLRFQASQNSALEPSAVIERIVSLLKDKEYQVKEVTDTSIIFSDNPWALRWSHQNLRRLDGGRFKIEVLSSGTLVSLATYWNLLPFLLIFVALITIPAIFAHDYLPAIIFSLFFTIAFALQRVASNDATREMLKNALDENVADQGSDN